MGLGSDSKNWIRCFGHFEGWCSKRFQSSSAYLRCFILLVVFLIFHQTPYADAELEQAFPDILIKDFSGTHDLVVEKIQIASNPPTHPVALQIDHHNRIWVVDRIDEDNAVIKNRSEKSKSVPTTSQNFRILTFNDSNGDGIYDTSAIFFKWKAGKSSNRWPVIFVDDESVYLGTEFQLSLLRDLNKDGSADVERGLLPENSWGSKSEPPHVQGLTKGPDGWLYFSMRDIALENRHQDHTTPTKECIAIFKCPPDGTHLEKVATGLHNPNDLVFDEHGNLFTCDKRESLESTSKWIHVIEGADYGYRTKKQNPLTEFLSHSKIQKDIELEKSLDQPAYVMPPIANIGGGPTALAYYSGVGMPNRLEHRFFLCNATNDSTDMMTFSHESVGTVFKINSREAWALNMAPNDLAFAPNGALFAANSNNEDNRSLSTGIYKIFSNQEKYAPAALQSTSILQSDLRNKTTSALLSLLKHSDQRVRIKAQSSLVLRGSSTLAPLVRLSRDPQRLLARLHSIWAIGQLAGSDQQIAGRSYIQSWLADLLTDPSPEVRAQAAILAGRIGNASIHPNITESLKDSSDRVRLMAALAIGQLRVPRAWEPMLAFVVNPQNQHSVLRHASVMALAGAFKENALSTLKNHPNRNVRLSGALALRQKSSKKIAGYLSDDSPNIMLETARMIHDLPVQDALPELAQLHSTRSKWIPKFAAKENISSGTPDLVSMLFWIYHANYLTGQSENLNALIEAVSDTSLPETMRDACLNWIKSWTSPDEQFSINRKTHLPQPRNKNLSNLILKKVAKNWLQSSNSNQQMMMLEYAEAFDWKEFQPSVLSLFRQFNAKPELRGTALNLLSTWQAPHFESLINEALVSNSALLRKEAILIQATLNPNDMVAKWTHLLEFGDPQEKLKALMQLGSIRDRRVDAVILYWLEKALQGDVPLDLIESLQNASAQRTAPAIKKTLEKWQTIQPKKIQPQIIP
jgi:quinoprotein glucose dehydrogenase